MENQTGTKSKGKATFVAQITRYAGDMALYSLSKGIKYGRMTTKFVVVGKPKVASGKSLITIWPADEEGRILSAKTFVDALYTNPSEALAGLGYTLS